MRVGRVSAASAPPSADLNSRSPKNIMNKFLLTSLCACAALSILGSVVVAQARSDSLRRELLTMLKTDQAERRACAAGATAELVNCFDKLGKTIDKDNTRKLQAIVHKYGLPKPHKVGTDGFDAFMTLMQHVTSEDLRRRCERSIRMAFRRKEVPPADFANFIDRLRLREGKPQIYGTGFDIKGGKLVLSKTRDLKNLDPRRKCKSTCIARALFELSPKPLP
jgi:hypothetical protein